MIKVDGDTVQFCGSLNDIFNELSRAVAGLIDNAVRIGVSEGNARTAIGQAVLNGYKVYDKSKEIGGFKHVRDNSTSEETMKIIEDILKGAKANGNSEE